MYTYTYVNMYTQICITKTTAADTLASPASHSAHVPYACTVGVPLVLWCYDSVVWCYDSVYRPCVCHGVLPLFNVVAASLMGCCLYTCRTLVAHGVLPLFNVVCATSVLGTHGYLMGTTHSPAHAKTHLTHMHTEKDRCTNFNTPQHTSTNMHACEKTCTHAHTYTHVCIHAHTHAHTWRWWRRQDRRRAARCFATPSCVLCSHVFCAYEFVQRVVCAACVVCAGYVYRCAACVVCGGYVYRCLAMSTHTDVLLCLHAHTRLRAI